ncbi:hypothetical protein WJX72_006566 [[Myrmecia] bisecta]|uniref:Uncharacterized protein n=1 Tax=[Myrmecia] bisecta TaxID=41462 RepID=A0AAW1R739_9CHLO
MFSSWCIELAESDQKEEFADIQLEVPRNFVPRQHGTFTSHEQMLEHGNSCTFTEEDAIAWRGPGSENLDDWWILFKVISGKRRSAPRTSPRFSPDLNKLLFQGQSKKKDKLGSPKSLADIEAEAEKQFQDLGAAYSSIFVFVTDACVPAEARTCEA